MDQEYSKGGVENSLTGSNASARASEAKQRGKADACALVRHARNSSANERELDPEIRNPELPNHFGLVY